MNVMLKQKGTYIYAILMVIGTVFLITGCTSVYYEDSWLDSPTNQHPSLTDLSRLVSTRFSNPDSNTLTKPVIITVHGYSATPFEWQEFADYAESDGSVLVSRVLLGGHVDNIEVFTTTTWQDWGYPIIEEYRALVALGFSRISIAAASAGAPLVLEPLASEKLKELPPPRHLFFVDPFIIPQDKNLNLIPLVGFIVGNVLEYDENTTEAELFNWYRNRPYQTLIQLNKLIKRVRKLLKKNIVLDQASKRPPAKQVAFLRPLKEAKFLSLIF
ncbi:MAG: hypothetical protein FVQ80_19410, partial [Planctomycetes bacterium]|nr:hypothetical protein [Planctomycetota bacterium]